jgi:predicted MPP superfamily phosphohydrolase
MTLFLITFLSLYGSMHVYAFIRLRGAFSLSSPARHSIVGLMLMMTFAPLFVRLAETNELASFALWIAWPAYLWMGSIFIFSTYLIVLDVARAAVWLLRRLSGTENPGFPSAAAACKLALALALVTSGYSVYEALKVQTVQVTITTSKLPPQTGRIRIVQISDVHLGLLFRETRLESVLQKVRDAHPDILVSTGDLVDGRLSREDTVSRMGRLSAMIAAVPAKAGKFAVAGNHEFYAGIGASVDFTRSAGFTVLRNQSIQLPDGITLSGVDDPGRESAGKTAAMAAESNLLKSYPNDRFHILLKHRPVVPATSDGRFDLQLSGHVHKGQIFPFNLLVHMQFPIPCGTSTTPANSLIHVSRGSGTWGPPMRFLAPPEVTIIDILPASSPAH